MVTVAAMSTRMFTPLTSYLFEKRHRTIYLSFLFTLAVFGSIYLIYWSGSSTLPDLDAAANDDDGFPRFLPVDSEPYSATDLVFYNKVGKCGSRSFMYLLSALGRRNRFTAAGQSKTREMRPSMALQEQEQLVKMILNTPRPATFYRHAHFINFNRFGFENPTYINIVRQPVPRLVSLYYHKRFGDGKIQRDTPSLRINQTINECVLQNKGECSGNNIFYIIPYFCGQDSRCRNTSRWALDRAKENVEKYFLFVGLSEEFEDTVKILEKMLPRYFEGAVEIYKDLGSGHEDVTKTKTKVAPSPEVVQILNARLALENEFYEFIKRRFYRLKAEYGLTPTTMTSD